MAGINAARLEQAIVEERFLAGTGPGGQNVNKVETNVQLRVAIAALALPLYARRNLEKLAGSRLTAEGELLIVAREHRMREANREAARERLADLVEKAMKKEARRIPTRATRSARRKRVDAKKKRGQKKSMRGPVKLD